jgi:SAF domain
VPVAPTEPVSPAPRRIATPSWLDARLIVGVMLVLGSVLLGARLVAGASHTYPAVAARHDLAAGTVLTAGDLKIARVRLPDHGDGVYLSSLDDAAGRQLSRAVSAGELVPAAAVTKQELRTTVTVPLAAGAAPTLHKGQRLEIWVSTPACGSVVLLPDVTVQAVHTDTSGAFDTGSDGQDVVISVPPQLADRVVAALAIENAALRAGVLVGTVTDARAGTTSGLPDLAACAGTPR